MADIQAVIFDLDGVIVSTDEYHYQGWKRLADELGVHFDRQINDRLRGVSRMASLDILLERADRSYSDDEKVKLAARKNGYYRQLITRLTPGDLLPGAGRVVRELKARGVKVAIGSSSRNARPILAGIGMTDAFDAIVDGNDIERSKPDPQVFTLAAERLGIDPSGCLVIEDADAGVEAGVAAGMRVLAVGAAAGHADAAASSPDLASITVERVLAIPVKADG